jgi:hypothetical protein
LPEEEGDHIISLRVKDDSDAWSEPDDLKVSVIDKETNLLPISDAGSPVSGTVGKRATLDGSGSYDPDGEITNYIWTSASHKVVLDNMNGPDPSFIPDEVGDYFFSLVVEDDDGASSDADRVTVHVTDPDALQPDDEDGRDPQENVKSGAKLILVAVIMFAIFLAGALAVLFIWGRKRKEGAVVAGIVEEAPTVCPACGSALEYSSDFQRYMCPSCGKYF